MTYSSEISRKNPGLFIFLIDQSRSMSHKIGGSDRSKAIEAADAINRQLNELINRCTKSEGIRDYFEIGIIGYGGARGQAFS
ncbi:MAG TPA: VWA domain-containing protein, partial [Thermoplasmataceae archaeon]|nr:VWA domain-containing protein [Thermoplasmataceae archaeon]